MRVVGSNPLEFHFKETGATPVARSKFTGIYTSNEKEKTVFSFYIKVQAIPVTFNFIIKDNNMKNIVETKIAAPPGLYEAYLYQYTNQETNQKYVGIHKGSVDDEYKHSSTNKEFQKVFSDSKSKLKYEVLYFGDYTEMKNIEHRILKQVDARNSDEYYNKSNGFPSYVEPDLEKCEELASQIKSGFFNVGKEALSLHVSMEYFQSRYQHSSELQKIVKERINDNDGNTDKCNPVLVYESRGDGGQDKRGDGNHTVFGADAAKHAVDIPVARVPYETHKEFSNEELLLVGNILNRKEDVVKKPIDISDGIKYVIRRYSAEGTSTNSVHNVKCLKAFGFTGSKTTGEIKSIITKADKLIDESSEIEELKRQNRLFINYKASPHNNKLADTVKAFSSREGVSSIYMSSAKFSGDRILEHLAIVSEPELNKTTIVVVVHHSSLKQEKLWKKEGQPHWINVFDSTLDKKFTIQFCEMPTTMSDGTQSSVSLPESILV